jgi:N4-(beta-N-acetylglucosaminyl)-L-asparaginase
MASRRKFLKTTAAAATAFAGWPAMAYDPLAGRPIVISTWNNFKANEAAWAILEKQGRALDAVEAGARIPEADPKDNSVGYGGLPDREGRVTLDACIMDEKGNCGAVVFVQGFKHVISIARLVMEKTPHVMLAGVGAEQFALAQGFQKEDLLTKESEQAWKEWLKTSKYQPTMKNFNLNHDTIGIVALDAAGNLSGACTTSGMAYKMHGRIGDSPIIGAGLYVDNEIGVAAATGVGEEVIKMVGSHLVVELMRQGKSPELACREAVERMVKRDPAKAKEIQVGFIALNKAGQFGGYSLQTGFTVTVSSNQHRHESLRIQSHFA